MAFKKKNLAKALEQMSLADKKEILSLLKAKEDLIRYNKLNKFTCYPFQKKFYDAGKEKRFRFLCAANRVGKSYSEAQEMAIHLTGRYPDWWGGKRFDHPIAAWAIGLSIDSTRKVLQKELFGTAVSKNDEELGTGSIPRDCIHFDTLEQERNLIKVAQIKHYDKDGDFDGYSTVEFRSTAQGEGALMGTAMDYIWLDEEDEFHSLKIFAQCVTRTLTTKGMVTITATPENGRTPLVDKFMLQDKKNNKIEDDDGDVEIDNAQLYWQQATWWDAPHISEKDIKEMLAAIPAWQHEMRSKGIPMMGSGMVYEVADEDIKCTPFEIPNHWPQICAMDIGFDHDTAAVWTAYDEAHDTIYVTDCYAMEGGVPSLHATAINARGKWIPVVLPHDAQNTERGSGMSVARYYEEAGVNALVEPFYNPIDWDGKKNRFVEPGLMNIRERMLTGRFKVFANCEKVFEEKGKYHRKEGRIVKKEDDTMDAMRYSALSVTHRGVAKRSSGYSSSAYEDNWKHYNDPYWSV